MTRNWSYPRFAPPLVAPVLSELRAIGWYGSDLPSQNDGLMDALAPDPRPDLRGMSCQSFLQIARPTYTSRLGNPIRPPKGAPLLVWKSGCGASQAGPLPVLFASWCPHLRPRWIPVSASVRDRCSAAGNGKPHKTCAACSQLPSS